MKKLFVVDTDKSFKNQVKSICPADEVDVQLFSSGMEIFSLIAKEKPYLVLLSLDVPDINDFVMYDLLKRTEDNSIPVVVIYSNQSENDLQQYKKMKFQPKEYCHKPISNDDIHRILKQHLELDEEDDTEFSDESIDRLVRGEYLKSDAKNKDDTKELPTDSQNDFNDEVAEAEESELEIAEILETGEDEISRPDKELKNQVISLEQQNEFLRSENKELANTIERLKAEIEESKKVEKEKDKLQIKLEALTDRLADKERELDARSYEFNKSLKNKSEELVQEAEERLRSKFSKKETQLHQDLEQLKEEKENLEQLVDQLQSYSDELKKREGFLNRSLSTLTEEKKTLSEKVKIIEEEKVILSKKVDIIEEEKNVLSEKVNTLKEDLSNQKQEMEEKESTHLSALENLNIELEKVLDRLHFYKSRVNELGGILQQALELTQPQNQE